jgi:hypothetical protein
MTGKVYKTAQGKTVDLGALILQNEDTRAVGNMKVNARGDRIDSEGNSIVSRSQQVNQSLKKQISNTNSDPVQTTNTRPTNKKG